MEGWQRYIYIGPYGSSQKSKASLLISIDLNMAQRTPPAASAYDNRYDDTEAHYGQSPSHNPAPTNVDAHAAYGYPPAPVPGYANPPPLIPNPPPKGPPGMNTTSPAMLLVPFSLLSHFL